MIIILIILIIYTVFLNMTLLFFYKEYRLCKLELDLIKRTVEWSVYEERKKLISGNSSQAITGMEREIVHGVCLKRVAVFLKMQIFLLQSISH